MVGIKKKLERRLDKREVKALKAAKLSVKIKEELLSRLKDGVYGGIYNFPEIPEMDDVEAEESESESEDFVAAYDDELMSAQDIEDRNRLNKPFLEF